MESLDNIDKKLFEGMMRGDIDAFEQLFQKYYVVLCNYCETLLEDSMEAEDVVQDLFVYLWTGRHIEICGAVRPYLFSSVKHRALNILKHQAVKRNYNALFLDFLKDISICDYSEEELILLEKIKNIIDHLPPQCQTVFMMSCMEGKKYKMIAEELGISVNTVKSHIAKAYREIRTTIGTEGLTLLYIFCNSSKTKLPSLSV